jgi:hypothetical protein
MNKKLLPPLLVLTSCVLIIVLSFAVVYLISDKNVHANDTVSTAPAVSVVDTVRAAVVSQPDALEEMISVNNPFEDVNSEGMTMSTSTQDPFSNLVIVIDSVVTSPSTNTITGDFTETFMGNTDITSSEPMSIVHRLRYEVDSVLVWTDAVGENFSWNQEPSRESIPFGSLVTITYSTKDASGVWVGDIQIEKPNP